MLRMRRISQVLAAAAVAVMGVQAANAAITVAWQATTPNPAAAAANKTQMNNLVNNGWTCYLLVATADATSTGVAGYDLSTPVSNPPDHVTSNNSGHDWGIFGTAIAQKWSFSDSAGDFVQSNYGSTSSQSGGLANTADSFFFSSANFAQGAAPSEDNNLLNGVATPPFDHNPNTSTDTAEYGVGTFMKGVGSIQIAGTVATQVLAQVWVPAGGGAPRAVGVVTDTAKAALFSFDTLVNVPEPASLGMLAVGGLALLARRRRA